LKDGLKNRFSEMTQVSSWGGLRLPMQSRDTGDMNGGRLSIVIGSSRSASSMPLSFHRRSSLVGLAGGSPHCDVRARLTLGG